MGKSLSDEFLIQNDLKDGYTLSLLRFNSALQCAISKAQENQE